MYSVMIVDDEPAAISLLTAIIEKKCPDFEVKWTANDGQEALSKMQQQCPDVLLFDIRMPIIDGLEMSKIVRELNLDVYMVAVSGYSEFEYARTAMKNGVVDYLLKPVMPSDMTNLFDRLKQKLVEKYFKKRIAIMRSFYQGEEVDEEAIARYFGEEDFFVAIARHNGLPSRFTSANGNEIYSDMHEMIYTYGRDERENLYLCPKAVVKEEEFPELIKKRVDKDTTEKGYCTLIYSSSPISMTDISDSVKKMYYMLDTNVVLGKNRQVDINHYKEKDIHMAEGENNVWTDFSYYIEHDEIKKAKKALTDLFQVWEQEERPILWIERRIRDISSSINKHGKNNNFDRDYQLKEYVLEDIFSNSQDYQQLYDGISEILFPSTEELKQAEKLDTSEFVDQICMYLQENIGEDLSVQKVSHQFNISPTYLGKLFRKHKGMSLNNFVTEIRMEKAKEILVRDKDILIKELSTRLGYQDQFYFSRVFCSYTGIRPSDFREKVEY